MNKLISFCCKFWIVFVPAFVIVMLFIFIAFLASLFSTLLSVVIGTSLIFFGSALIAYFITDCLEDFWDDLYNMSVENKWNENLQKFLKFLKEN